jgi:hypothetical protein
MRTRLAALIGIVITALACASTPQAKGDWVVLGQRAVTDRVDRDVISVTAARGDFRQVKLKVERASVDFRRVVVHFGNGTNQDLEIRSTIPVGGETRVIDLSGNERVIRSVEFWYDANTQGRQAVVRLLGRH